MPELKVKDVRPKIELGKDEEDRLVRRLEEMAIEAIEFRNSSGWDEKHAQYWQMYLSEPDQEVRTWPWDQASNLVPPLIQVAVNTSVAQEYDAMLAREPKVVGFEGEDTALAEDLSQYYFEWFYKERMPLELWGSDWLLNNAVDGTSAMRVSQRTDFTVRRREEHEAYIARRAVKLLGSGEENPADIMPPEPEETIEYRWREHAWIERIDETEGHLADLERIYVAPGSGPSFQPPICPWYYVEAELSWSEVLSLGKALGWRLESAPDPELKAYLGQREPSDKERIIADREGTNANARAKTLTVREYYMAWPLPARYMFYDEEKRTDGTPASKELDQPEGDEEGYEEEIVVQYVPAARRILLVRPLSRVCPDGKRPHTGMHYRRLPGCFHGIGLPADMRHLQAASNSNWNQMVDYGTLVNCPGGFYSPANMGMMSEIQPVAPGVFQPVMDPRGIVFNQFRMDPNFYFGIGQSVQAWAEKVALVTEQMMGRAPTTPNAPRTARGQLAMMQMSNVAFGILTAIHSQSFIEFFRRVHAFKCRWQKPLETYRVMNRQTGMFEQRQISSARFRNASDVDFRFSLNANRSQEQQVAQALFGMTISSIQQALQAPMLAPIIRQLLSEVYQSLGKKNLDQIWPKNLISTIMAQAQMNRQQPPQQQGQQPNMPRGPGAATPTPTGNERAMDELKMPSVMGMVQ